MPTTTQRLDQPLQPGTDAALKAARNMEMYGGGFAEAIALAYFRADRTNQRKLFAAFADLFQQFA